MALTSLVAISDISAHRTMLCSEKNPLKICKHCGKVFYAKNPKAEYDTSKCRNQANVYKSRNKNKAE